MEKYKSHKKSWIIVFVLFFTIIPCILFFGCSEPEVVDSTGEIHTVHFYTGTGDRFNIDNVEIVDGDLCPKPQISQSRYYDEATGETKQFIGWYSTQSCEDGTMWNFNSDKVRSTMTLYAKWEVISNSEN